MDFYSSPSVYSGYFKPALLAENEKYILKIAETEDEFSQVFRMRTQSFQHFDNSGEIDRDKYDDKAMIIIALRRSDNAVRGTYRFMNHPGNRLEDMYSGEYFDLSPLPPGILPVSFEIGRTCVADSDIEENSAIISLFWKGIGAMLHRGRWRYLIGSVSVFNPEPARVWAMAEYFEQNGCTDRKMGMCSALSAVPRPSDAEMTAYRAKYPNIRRTIPPLLRSYMTIGSKIISEPQYCAHLGCAHFLVCLDMANLPSGVAKRFSPNGTLPPHLSEL